jgi:prephenate dehydrogenase
MQPTRLSILGVGLLGGSIGLAVKAAGIPCQVVGYGHRRESLDRALEVGAIDESAISSNAAVKDADLVILCTPVGLFEKLLAEIAADIPDRAIVTDVGSTKRTVGELASRILARPAQFVGSHPMAGSEKRGVEFARADLFQGARCIVTPTPGSSSDEVAGQVEQFWQKLGMTTTRMSPAEHDRLICDVSHLPHAVAAALIAMQSDAALPLAGKGFLDTTRIAGGDGALWRDILHDNADNLADSLARFRARLDELEKLLAPDQRDALAKWLDDAAARRAKLLAEKLRELEP